MKTYSLDKVKNTLIGEPGTPQRADYESRLAYDTMKPILFSTPMVQAILDGRKTQTRRIIKNPTAIAVLNDNYKSQIVCESFAPYQPGDILYVRETFAKVGCIGWSIDQFEYNYRADYWEGKWSGSPDMCFEKWSSSIHMPKEAARIFLKVTAVKAERLQDITEADAIAEGVEWKIKFPKDHPELKFWKDYEWTKREKFSAGLMFGPKESFRSLWRSINGPDSWAANPYVFAYTFERCCAPKI